MRYILIIIFFILSGEFIARVGNYIEPKHELPKNKYSKKLGKNIYKNRNIFLLGNSFAMGFGMEKKNRIPDKLANIDKFELINKGSPGNTWLHYMEDIVENKKMFQQDDIIIICACFRDANYPKGKIFDLLNLTQNKLDQSYNNQKEDKQVSIVGNKQTRTIISTLFQSSYLIKFLRTNIRNTFLRNGILLPYGMFYYLNKFAYNEKKDELHAALDYIDNISQKHHLNVIIYLMPDFNLLSQSKYFTNFILLFKNYERSSIKVINGIEQFSEFTDGKYCLSVRNAHPNGEAHLMIADTLIKTINSISVW